MGAVRHQADEDAVDVRVPAPPRLRVEMRLDLGQELVELLGGQVTRRLDATRLLGVVIVQLLFVAVGGDER
ncbi:hypothetical protein BRD56_08295 [Thermoplasmatales archaeon SW_10_69_26]|nr:MAG: hypothetical protein BRD56_08295 [Thermoplasmatales archaeon SW_10_69_26]